MGWKLKVEAACWLKMKSMHANRIILDLDGTAWTMDDEEEGPILVVVVG